MNFPVSQIRIARPTNQLQALLRFYNEGLQLPVIGSFDDHDGYDGVMLGMPDGSVHLEFTQHINGSPCKAPSKDNLLVLYFNSRSERDAIAQRLNSLGYEAVEPENPYWLENGLTFEDPDAWRVVLYDRPGFQIESLK